MQAHDPVLAEVEIPQRQGLEDAQMLQRASDDVGQHLLSVQFDVEAAQRPRVDESEDDVELRCTDV